MLGKRILPSRDNTPPSRSSGQAGTSKALAGETKRGVKGFASESERFNCICVTVNPSQSPIRKGESLIAIHEHRYSQILLSPKKGRQRGVLNGLPVIMSVSIVSVLRLIPLNPPLKKGEYIHVLI